MMTIGSGIYIFKKNNFYCDKPIEYGLKSIYQSKINSLPQENNSSSENLNFTGSAQNFKDEKDFNKIKNNGLSENNKLSANKGLSENNGLSANYGLSENNGLSDNNDLTENNEYNLLLNENLSGLPDDQTYKNMPASLAIGTFVFGVER
ncbi:hypothetical protein DMUE_1908 [Dictyocoela muelleri]|nr:hypothetical protein DMUE_1908 [Dictyocoela muelleri]